MAAEPARPEPVLRNGRGHNSERPAYRKKTKKPQTLQENSSRTPSERQSGVEKEDGGGGGEEHWKVRWDGLRTQCTPVLWGAAAGPRRPPPAALL